MANSSHRSSSTRYRSVSPSIVPRHSTHYHSYNHLPYAHLNGTPVADSITGIITQPRRHIQRLYQPQAVEYDDHRHDSSQWTPPSSPSVISSSSSFRSSSVDPLILPDDSIADYELRNTLEVPGSLFFRLSQFSVVQVKGVIGLAPFHSPYFLLTSPLCQPSLPFPFASSLPQSGIADSYFCVVEWHSYHVYQRPASNAYSSTALTDSLLSSSTRRDLV
ncbi:unnamed protein product [Cyclocybe aegerita]|uniref:Uncharacterized protein n=1 Tax=Cyclocybe aegerita TaxID=1973307 RepID=A0A8S0XIV1_CYCAE|nr:unnamed protein product [Cyclocybe aegerita]